MKLSTMNGASRYALMDGEARALGAMRLAFPGCRVMAGPVPDDIGIGFGVVFGPGRKHAVRVGSWDEYPDAIGLLKAWNKAN